MISPRWRKVLRDLWSNKTRTILVVLSVAVGVFGIGAITHTQVLVSRELTAIYARSSPASATIYTGEPFDDDLVQVVRAIPGVAAAEGRRTTTVRLRMGADEWRAIQLFVIPDYADIQVNKVYLTTEFAASPQFGAERGRWPPGAGEVLIERSSLLLPGLFPADAAVDKNITIETLNGRQRELRITGLAHDPNRIPATFANQPYGYITFETFENLGGPRNYDELHIIVAGDKTDKAHITSVARAVTEKIERGGLSVAITQIPEPGKRPVVDDIFQGITLVLGSLGILVLFLSGFLVVNTISALLAQQIRQIGMMKAIGARRGQVMVMYIVTVLIIGALALLIAIPLAALVARETAAYMAGFINVDFPPFSLPADVLAIEITIGLVVPLLAALAPIISGTRVTVLEAISSYGLGKGRFGRGWIDRAVEQVRFLPRPMLISLRNTFRRKGRLLLTLATLTMSGTIFMAILSVQSSLNLTLEKLLEYFQYDVQVNLARSYRIEQIQREALQIPGVVEVESWAATAARRMRSDDTEGDSFIVFAPPAATRMLKPTLIEGRWLLPDDENAIVLSASVLTQEPDLKVGSPLTIKINRRETEWQLVGVVQVVANQVGYVNYPYFARISREIGRASSLQIVTAQHDATFQAEVARALEERFKALGIRTQGTFTIGQVRQGNQFFFTIIVSLLLAMATLLAVVGAFGLTGTMSINVLERTREIGVMRAIGASNGSVRRIVLVEGVLIGLLSWAAGALLALLLSKPLADAVGVALLQTALDYSFATSGVILWLVIVLILSIAASLLPAWNASRLTVREVLAYE